MRGLAHGQLFTDRRQAGQILAARLAGRPWSDPLVLGLVRGGVPVAVELARGLHAELDVAIALKIGAPDQPEFGIGAVTPDAAPVYDTDALAGLGLEPEDLRARCEQVQAEARRRRALYRDDRPPPRVRGRSVVIVDDGLATGVTARAALRAVRPGEPKELILAVPVGASDSAASLRAEADEVICAEEPADFRAVGAWYRRFDQTTDAEVLALLARPPG